MKRKNFIFIKAPIPTSFSVKDIAFSTRSEHPLPLSIYTKCKLIFLSIMKLLLNINHAGDTALRPGDELQGTLIVSGIASQKRPHCTATIGGEMAL